MQYNLERSVGGSVGGRVGITILFTSMICVIGSFGFAQSQAQPKQPDSTDSKPDSPAKQAEPKLVVPAPTPDETTMKLESDSFVNETAFPKEFTEDGEGNSPALKWKDAPKGTVSFAIMMDDPNARGFCALDDLGNSCDAEHVACQDAARSGIEGSQGRMSGSDIMGCGASGILGICAT